MFDFSNVCVSPPGLYGQYQICITFLCHLIMDIHNISVK